MKKALLLLGHADPESFNARIAATYRDAFTRAGGEATLVSLPDLVFDPVLRRGFRGEQAIEPDLQRVRGLIEATDHIVWVFPTYWASPPAVVRALVDRLFLPGWAFRNVPGKSLPEGLLAGRSSRVLTTMDSPSLWYSLWHHRAIHGSFVNGTLKYVGLSPVQTSVLYNTRKRTPEERERWLTEITAHAEADLAKLQRQGGVKRAVRELPTKAASQLG